MAYTQDDLAAIRFAILEIARGERVVKCEFNGRKTEYADTQLKELQALETTIQQSLKLASKKRRSRTRYVTTSKGL